MLTGVLVGPTVKTFLDCLKSVERGTHFRRCIEYASVAEIKVLFYYKVSLILSEYGYRGSIAIVADPSEGRYAVCVQSVHDNLLYDIGLIIESMPRVSAAYVRAHSDRVCVLSIPLKEASKW